MRGGDQDRMISIDFIVPKSGLCRSRRFVLNPGVGTNAEKKRTRRSAAENTATNGLKLAAKSEKSQQAVWDNVNLVQANLSQNVGASVNSAVSASSMELSMEDSKVKETSAAYINTLSGLLQSRSDVIGYVLAINGKVTSADVYASHALFAKLWPKLLKSNAAGCRVKRCGTQTGDKRNCADFLPSLRKPLQRQRM